MTSATHPDRPRVGISSCLLGQEVRWNGAHKLEPVLIATLGPLFEWVPVCPEVELGLGVPREPIRLEGDPASPRLVARDTRLDLTGRMEAFAARRAGELEGLGLCGYILKSGSPTCGMEGVEVQGLGPRPAATGVGLFARALRRRLPLLPVVEETALRDPARRDRFVARVRERYAALLMKPDRG